MPALTLSRERAAHDRSETSLIFERVVLAAILTNTAVLVAGLIDHAHEELLSAIEAVLLVFFVCEIALRWRRVGWSRPHRNLWLVADTVIIALALIPMLGPCTTIARIGRLARLLHVGKHLLHLRLGRHIMRVLTEAVH
jgi:hypothetical protein